MPITKAVIGQHSCVPPSVSTLISAGYLPGTEWTCDVCDEAHTITEGGGAMPFWVAASAPAPEQPMPEEPALHPYVGEIPGEPVPCLPEILEPEPSQVGTLEEPWVEIVGEMPTMPTPDPEDLPE